jgi:hypothetical protein
MQKAPPDPPRVRDAENQAAPYMNSGMAKVNAPSPADVQRCLKGTRGREGFSALARRETWPLTVAAHRRELSRLA